MKICKKKKTSPTKQNKNQGFKNQSFHRETKLSILLQIEIKAFFKKTKTKHME